MLAAAGYRSALCDAEDAAASREALRARLAALVRERERSPVGRFVPRFGGASRWVMICPAIVAVVLLVRVGHEPGGRFQPGAIAPVEDDALPVASLTPGATWSVTAEELCAPGAHEQRRVPDAVRVQVLRGYGMEHEPAERYELDYLITPELGGAPSVENLWPQRYASRTWNAHVKDQLERLLPQLVCDGTVALQTAQREIAADWVAAYRKYFRTDVPRLARADLRDNAPPDSIDDDLVYPIWRSGEAPALRLVSFAVSR